jgi:glycosyltransferase involved in cell wall biosynthesis
MTQRKHTKFVNLANPLVGILTPTFNRPGWLQMAIQSVVAQTYPNWEQLVVNDHGMDVQQIVDSFNDPRIKYFTNDQNYDLAKTRNIAISKSNADYFVMLDDDDILYESALEFRLNLIKKFKVEVAYTRALRVFYERKNDRYVPAGNSLYWDSSFDHNLILVQNTCPCNCLLFSRKAHEKAGDFDETLTTSEDWAHSVEMSRYFDFKESKVIDCQCSFRTDNTQMTGSRTGYTDHLPYLFKKWRAYATNPEWVVEAQNQALRNRGLDPAQYGL